MGDERVGALLAEVGLADTIDVTIDGHDPVLASKFPIGEAAATAIAAAGAAAAQCWAARTDETQNVRVDVAHAAAALVSFMLQRVDGAHPPDVRPERVLTALYETRDARWIHLHGGFPHLAARTRVVLDLDDRADRDAIAAAVRRHDAFALEDELAAAGACAAVARTAAEWDAHPQATALAPLGRVTIDQVAPGEPVPAGCGDRPLGGLRVLDLTRVLAGPTVGRTLAEHGADVLLVNSPERPNVPAFVVDTGHGKRSAFVDLDTPDGAARLAALAREADVFVQGYRAGALERRGFGPEVLADGHRGLVYVTVNCYGDAGPWRARGGWEQMAESCTGIADAQGEPDAPALVPAAACDYTTGYLGALGVMAALARRAFDGGSYHVRVSLCQTGAWIRSLGAVCDARAATGLAGTSARTITTETPFGRLQHLSPVAQLSKTPARWARPPVLLGTDEAVWLNG